MTTTFIGIASSAAAQPGPGAGAGPRWRADVEKEFSVGRGMVPKLMTEDEWKEHHQQMRTRSRPLRRPICERQTSCSACGEA